MIDGFVSAVKRLYLGEVDDYLILRIVYVYEHDRSIFGGMETAY